MTALWGMQVGQRRMETRCRRLPIGAAETNNNQSSAAVLRTVNVILYKGNYEDKQHSV